MWKTADFFYLVLLGLRERWGRTLLTVSALAFAVAVNSIAFFLGYGFLRDVVRRAEDMFPRSLLTVRPRTLDLAAFRFNASTLGDREVQKIAALSGVEFVAPQLSLKMPLRAEGEIMGQSATTDAVVVGIDPRLVEKDVAPGFSFSYDPQTSQPIPCIIPRFFLDMYNLAYADSLGLPKISETYPIGKEFSLVLGETYLLGGPQGKSATLRCRIVGLSQQSALMVGILIPLGHAKAINEWYQGNRAPVYNAAHVKLADLNAFDEVTSAIRGMGFTVESQGETLDKFLLVARVGKASITLFCVLIAAIAAIAVFNTYSLALMVRRGEVTVLRAVGATRSYVVALLLADSLVAGAVAGVIGGAIGVGASGLVHVVLTRLVPNVALLPQRLPYTLSTIWSASVAGAVLLSVVVTLPLAWRHGAMGPIGAGGSED